MVSYGKIHIQKFFLVVGPLRGSRVQPPWPLSEKVARTTKPLGGRGGGKTLVVWPHFFFLCVSSLIKWQTFIRKFSTKKLFPLGAKKSRLRFSMSIILNQKIKYTRQMPSLIQDFCSLSQILIIQVLSQICSFFSVIQRSIVLIFTEWK